MQTTHFVRYLPRLEGLTSFFLRRLFGYARLIRYVATISALALKAHIDQWHRYCLLPATNVTAPAIPVLCIEADFAILRNCMTDNRLDSPDRQTMVTLINYGLAQ
jgi:hypothetical protein